MLPSYGRYIAKEVITPHAMPLTWAFGEPPFLSMSLHSRSHPAPPRLLIARGFLDIEVNKDYDSGLMMYDKALAIIEWGRREWKDATANERGVIFKDTFLRGARNIRLNAYKQVRIRRLLHRLFLTPRIIGPKPRSNLWGFLFRDAAQVRDCAD